MCVGGGGGAAAAVLLHGWITTVFYTFSIRFLYVFYSRFFLQPLPLAAATARHQGWAPAVFNTFFNSVCRFGWPLFTTFFNSFFVFRFFLIVFLKRLRKN